MLHPNLVLDEWYYIRHESDDGPHGGDAYELAAIFSTGRNLNSDSPPSAIDTARLDDIEILHRFSEIARRIDITGPDKDEFV
jgi:hypothetical protein